MNPPNPHQLQQLTYALAVGDAMGVPYEGCARGETNCTGMTGGGGRGLPAGAWSDDTALTLATIDSLRHHGWQLDEHDLLNRMWHWLDDGAYTPDGHSFGGSEDTLAAIRGGKPRRHWLSGNDNGALKRMMPFAFTDLDDTGLLRAAGVTHENDVTSVAYVHLLRRLLGGSAFDDAVRSIGWGRALSLDEWEVVSNSTFVDSTLIAGIWCAGTSVSYRQAVLKAVNLGGDTDTIGAITGTLAAAAYGLDTVPGEWKSFLLGSDLLESITLPINTNKED